LRRDKNTRDGRHQAIGEFGVLKSGFSGFFMVLQNVLKYLQTRRLSFNRRFTVFHAASQKSSSTVEKPRRKIQNSLRAGAACSEHLDCRSSRGAPAFMIPTPW
jgi:hypothetical protein